MPYRRGKGRNKQSGTEIEFQSIWNGTIDHVKNILSDNYRLTHDILSDSIQCCDAHKVIEWAPGTFADKVSKLMGGKQWLPPTKAMRYLPIFKTWCDEANAIKKRDKMQIFIERKRSVTSSGIILTTSSLSLGFVRVVFRFIECVRHFIGCWLRRFVGVQSVVF
eukprot:476451_1